MGKRTTIIFDQKDRQYIEQLIRDGKEAGIKPFITKMLNIYRSMAIYDWKFPGEYYIGMSRAAFITQQHIQLLIDIIPEAKQRAEAQKIGAITALTIQAGLNLDPHKKENWPKVLERLKILGYGDIILREEFIVLRNPFINNLRFLTGFLEGVLSSKLDAKLTTSPLVFEISKE